jgi:hypothetical protein
MTTSHAPNFQKEVQFGAFHVPVLAMFSCHAIHLYWRPIPLCIFRVDSCIHRVVVKHPQSAFATIRVNSPTGGCLFSFRLSESSLSRRRRLRI